MLQDSAKLNLLILAGGESSRMGKPKHLLINPTNGKPLYRHLIDALRDSVHGRGQAYLSLHAPNDSIPARLSNEGEFSVLYDSHPSPAARIGPAAGLLAAHNYDSSAYWLVVAVDYPLVTISELQRLKQEFEEPITCFVNDQGFQEPLLAIWSPIALQVLRERVESGRSGPRSVIKTLEGKTLKPKDEVVLRGANTPEEWESIMAILSSAGS